MYEPHRITRNVPASDASISASVHPSERPASSAAPPSARQVTSVTTVMHATTPSAIPRWASLTHHASSVHTTTAPSNAATSTRNAPARLGNRIQGSPLWRRTASTATANVSSPTTDATRRWLNSTSGARSKTGITRPSHSGQSGHPRPEPVTLTTPPSDTCTMEATSAASARYARALPGRRPSLTKDHHVVPIVQICTIGTLAHAPLPVNET